MRFFEIATVAMTTVSTAYGTPTKLYAPAVDKLVGFAEGTTGGGSGAGTTVTSCAELTAAVNASGVIKIKGMLTGCGIVQITQPNTSLLGVDNSSGLTDGGLRIFNTFNIIIRNLKLHRAPLEQDLIQIRSSEKIWIDHNDLSSVGVTGDKDAYDGLLDINHGSDNITVSWTIFQQHWKASLIGHADNNTAQDSGKLRVTYHHNHFDCVYSRQPSIRFGIGHVYSSCYDGGLFGSYSGINSRMGARVLVESNSFTNVERAIATNLDTVQEGYADVRDNIFNNSTLMISQNASYVPPYQYTVEPVISVCNTVKKSAGVGVVTF